MPRGTPNIRHTGRGILGRIKRLWKKLPPSFRWNLEDSFQPEDITERLLPGEEPQLQINLARYRDIWATIMFDFFWVMFFVTLAITLVLLGLGYWLQTISPLYALLPPAAFVLLFLFAVREHLVYKQWRLVKTNARLIISIPQPGSTFFTPLVDNIELKGLPNVIDTNWSRNPFWRSFQFATGARDLYLSLAGYRFVEGTARVGDALVIPDVMPDDVVRLKRLVFSVPSPPKPQKVVFASPQKVIVTEENE